MEDTNAARLLLIERLRTAYETHYAGKFERLAPSPNVDVGRKRSIDGEVRAILRVCIREDIP